MIQTRRNLMAGILATATAPALVRAESIMRINPKLALPGRFRESTARYIDIPVQRLPDDMVWRRGPASQMKGGWSPYFGYGTQATAVVWIKGGDLVNVEIE